MSHWLASFSSIGNVEKSIPTASKPAFATSTHFVSECVWSAFKKMGRPDSSRRLFHDCSELACTKEISLSFERADQYGNLDSIGGCNNRLQQHEISNIEVGEGRDLSLQMRQDIS